MPENSHNINIDSYYITNCINWFILSELNNYSEILLLTQKCSEINEKCIIIYSLDKCENVNDALKIFYSKLYLNDIYSSSPKIEDVLKKNENIIKEINDTLPSLTKEDYAGFILQHIIDLPFGYYERIINDYNNKNQSFENYIFSYTFLYYGNKVDYIPSTITLDNSYIKFILVYLNKFNIGLKL